MSDPDASPAASRSASLPRKPPLAQQLPQDVVLHIARSLCAGGPVDPHPTLEACQRDAKSFMRVCKAWRPAGIAALWREFEVKASTASALQKHLETHPELHKHVESLMIDIEYDMGSSENGLTAVVPAVVALFPRLSRLEIFGAWVQPGPLLKAPQRSADLSNLMQVVITWSAGSHSIYASKDRRDRIVSPLILFTFLRDCKSLRHFAYNGWAEYVNLSTTAPIERRIRLDTLRIDVLSPRDVPVDQPHALAVRARFLEQFDLAHLVEFGAFVYLADTSLLAALDRMVNLGGLRLTDPLVLEHGHLEGVTSRLGRLTKLRELEIGLTVDDEPAEPGRPSPANLQRLLDAVPSSVEILELYIPLPQQMADTWFESRVLGALKDMYTRVYDPLEVEPKPRHTHLFAVTEMVDVEPEWDECGDSWSGDDAYFEW
ncbi:hypothetical protein DMC30DRAFT_419025 [Rhodotorula diobovata]|uniref:Proteophosphoglycan ppg4 n=1 Tax=Rhodotorula diobovata TaxID=5288 RepID=A0A5C5FNP4_9BASI|nr:hypothetical protein DMC30DRAFT_419025 [Rhodotorula diobovata]